VDFDHGLNKAINKIRDALSDSVESPRFVETVARRGCRFLAEVKVIDAAGVQRSDPRNSTSAHGEA
jgi:DNA-binding winged helix-turn-helix (wHTH) protein